MARRRAIAPWLCVTAALLLGCGTARTARPSAEGAPSASDATSTVAVPRAPSARVGATDPTTSTRPATSSNVPPEVPSSVAPPTVVLGKARGPVGSAQAAVRSFRAAWSEDVVTAAVSEPRKSAVAHVDATVRTGRLDAHRLSCREARDRVESTLGPQETESILFSAIPALDREGSCWEVALPVTVFNNLLAYVDAATGALLLVWITPEG